VPPGLFNYLPGYSDFTPKGLGTLSDYGVRVEGEKRHVLPLSYRLEGDK